MCGYVLMSPTDVAGSIRAMASYSWDEMLTAQQAKLMDLLDSSQLWENRLCQLGERIGHGKGTQPL